MNNNIDEKIPRVSIEKEVVALIKAEPFFAHFIQQMRRIYTTQVATMGVNITDQINLYINPYFLKSLTPQERVAVLKHEVLHIINKHIIRIQGKNYNHAIMNVAMDIAINQFIKPLHNRGQLIAQLPKDALLPEHYKLPLNLTAEEYYKLLMKNAKICNVILQANPDKPCTNSQCAGEQGEGEGEGKEGEDSKGGGGKDKEGEDEKDGKGKGDKKDKDKHSPLDDHKIWEQGNDSEDYQHQIVKSAIKETLEKTEDYGSLPSSLLAEIRKALRHETLNWRAILQHFIHRATIVNTMPTRKKPNRRYGVYFDGSKVECKLDMLIAIDTSGSISDTELCLFFSEIEKIKALGMTINVVECDADIQKVYKYKNIPHVVAGRGGTAFEPVFNYVRDKCKPKPNCILYLTDLYGNLNFKNVSRVPTLWVVTTEGGNEKEVPFGMGIKLKDDRA